jgi:PBSX family phage terminase large subunit
VTSTELEVIELRHTYSPRGAARKLLGCRDRRVLLSGPAGTGKSRACLEKMNLAALKYPGMRALIVRQVRDTLASTALKTLEEFVIKEQIAAGAVTYHGASGREPARYKHSNGSELWLAGLDKPSKIMSTEFDMIYVQEATEIQATAWQKLTTRLRRFTMPYRQIIADCNPDAPTHWLKQQANEGVVTMLESRHQDNPLLYGDDGARTPEGLDYLATLDALTGVVKLRLRDGLWVAAEGVIWGEFDPARHIVERFDIPADWPRIWVVDFGHVHPFVCTFWAVAPDGQLYRYREIHMTGRMVEDHAKQIMGIVRPGAEWRSFRDQEGWHGGTWIEPRPVRIICDHDSEDRATLKRYLGLANHPANKTVKPGLEAVNKRFKEDRIFFLKNSLVERDKTLRDARKPTVTEDEIGGYVWDENKEAPVKEDDDGCDTVRYVVSHFDLKQRLSRSDRQVWV